MACGAFQCVREWVRGWCLGSVCPFCGTSKWLQINARMKCKRAVIAMAVAVIKRVGVSFEKVASLESVVGAVLSWRWLFVGGPSAPFCHSELRPPPHCGKAGGWSGMSANFSNWQAKSLGIATSSSLSSSLGLAFFTLVEASCKGESACGGTRLVRMNLTAGDSSDGSTTGILALVCAGSLPRLLCECADADLS